MSSELVRAKNLIWSALQNGCTKFWKEDALNFLGVWNPYGFNESSEIAGQLDICKPCAAKKLFDESLT